MVLFNDKYNEEIKKIIDENPKAYGKMIKSKGFHNRYQDRTYLYEYILKSTEILNTTDFKYSFKTRIYWTINKISNWENSLVCCKVCGKPIKNWNIDKLKNGYKTTCCDECERKIASNTNKDTCLKKYGVVNVFQRKSIRDDLNNRKAEIYRKREENNMKLYGITPKKQLRQKWKNTEVFGIWKNAANQ